MVAAEGSAANSTSAIEGLYAQATGDFVLLCNHLEECNCDLSFCFNR